MFLLVSTQMQHAEESIEANCEGIDPLKLKSLQDTPPLGILKKPKIHLNNVKIMRYLLTAAITFSLAVLGASLGAGECVVKCNSMKLDVLTLEICREAKKTLPRPKVGDFCSVAMEQGFSDACVPLCLGETPTPRIAQACRAAAIEMPRPTVRKWCEHGYRQGYTKTIDAMKLIFGTTASASAPIELKTEDPIPEPPHTPRTIAESIPITLDDTTVDLIIYEGQGAEEAVVTFCQENLPDDVAGCVQQLLPTVLERAEN